MGLGDIYKGAVSFATGKTTLDYLGGSGSFDGSGTGALDLIPGIGDARAQERANQINIQQAEINRRFQERMSNTAYQRAMADMEKAGLNPILAYQQGGASVPTGATATVESASKTGLADMALRASTGISQMRNQATSVQQQQAMTDSQVKLNAASAAKNVADAEKARMETRKVQEETKGLGRKAEEGSLWQRFYKGINGILDSAAKDVSKRQDELKSRREKTIKVLGPAKYKDIFGDSKGFNLP